MILITVVFTFSFSSCVTTVKATPSKVVVVQKLAKTHKIVYVKGQRYYKWNGNHYRKTNSGYMVIRL